MRLNRSNTPMFIGLGLALLSLEGAAALGVAPLVSNAIESRNTHALLHASTIAGRALVSTMGSLITRLALNAAVRTLGEAPGVRVMMVRMTPEACAETAPHARSVRVIVGPVDVLQPAAAPRMRRGATLARPALFRQVPAAPGACVGVWGNVL